MCLLSEASIWVIRPLRATKMKPLKIKLARIGRPIAVELLICHSTVISFVPGLLTSILARLKRSRRSDAIGGKIHPPTDTEFDGDRAGHLRQRLVN
jgi:hypothetical protein